ncbi:MAG: hypothetical protein AB1586_27295 [Pseudomonadota bacterium]
MSAPTRRTIVHSLLLALLLLPVAQRALARGGLAGENPWNPEHVTQLPAEIRAQVEQLAKACGIPPAATHYFALSLDTPQARFIALHFEDFACADRAAICDAAGCQHDIYVSAGGPYRRVLRLRARDVTLTRRGEGVGLDVSPAAAGPASALVWDGHHFVAPRR